MNSIVKQVADALKGAKPADRMELANELRKAIAGACDFRNPIDVVLRVPVDMVCPNDYNPNSVASKEMELLAHSIRQDGYCVEENTPILMANLTWKPAGTLLSGERIVAFDESATGEGHGRKQRRYRTAEVTSNSTEKSPLVRVLTDRGDLLVTPDHPFLAKVCYGKGHYSHSWVVADKLKPGDIVIHLMKPWEIDRSYDAGWLSGFLDGEGTCAKNQVSARELQTVRLSGYQRPGPTADRMVAEIGRRVVSKVFTVERKESDKWNDMVMCRVDRITEVMRLLGSVRPERLLTMAGEFWEGSALVGRAFAGASDAKVISVSPAKAGKIARLSTSSKTYIANGFAVHNTKPVVTIWDAKKKKYVIVDGFHRYFVGKSCKDVNKAIGGFLPIVVIEKTIRERMAATVRHNRARGEHSVAGMSKLVFSMLEEGYTDADVCNHIGLEVEELLKLKHLTGFAKLFADVEYSKAWETRKMLKLRKDYESKSEPGKVRAVVVKAKPKARKASK